MVIIGVRDQFRLGGGGGDGLGSCALIFSPALADNQVVLPGCLLILLPESDYLKSSGGGGGLQPPSLARLVYAYIGYIDCEGNRFVI